MAKDMFSIDGVKKTLGSLKEKFDDFSKIVDDINNKMPECIGTSSGTALYGSRGSKVISDWGKNSPEFAEFTKNFDSWSSIVGLIVMNNEEMMAQVQSIYDYAKENGVTPKAPEKPKDEDLEADSAPENNPDPTETETKNPDTTEEKDGTGEEVSLSYKSGDIMKFANDDSEYRFVAAYIVESGGIINLFANNEGQIFARASGPEGKSNMFNVTYSYPNPKADEHNLDELFIEGNLTIDDLKNASITGVKVEGLDDYVPMDQLKTSVTLNGDAVNDYGLEVAYPSNSPIIEGDSGVSYGGKPLDNINNGNYSGTFQNAPLYDCTGFKQIHISDPSGVPANYSFADMAEKSTGNFFVQIDGNLKVEWNSARLGDGTVLSNGDGSKLLLYYDKSLNKYFKCDGFGNPLDRNGNRLDMSSQYATNSGYSTDGFTTDHGGCFKPYN